MTGQATGFDLKKWMAIVTFVFFIIGTIAGLSSTLSDSKSDINVINNKQLEYDTELEKMNQIILNHEIRTATVEAHFEHITEKLDRIEDRVYRMKVEK